jgi:hypothetical protein
MIELFELFVPYGNSLGPAISGRFLPNLYLYERLHLVCQRCKREREKKVFINVQLRSSWLSHNIQVPWYHKKKKVYKIQIRRAKKKKKKKGKI